jgi:hypothetical protein
MLEVVHADRKTAVHRGVVGRSFLTVEPPLRFKSARLISDTPRAMK